MTLISPASSDALGDARFDDGSPLDDRGVAAARAAAASLPARQWRQFCAPSPRCRQTADALGLRADVEPALRDCDMGAWRGRTLHDVGRHDHHAFSAWHQDPAHVPPGGESRLDFGERIAAWLDRTLALAQSARIEGDEVARRGGRMVVVAEPGVIRMAVLHALSAPPEAFWRIDVPPLSATHLVGRGPRWNLRSGPLDP
ncbi:histidine phosphatase family protein [Streptomyces sp. NPDC047108]|uniref:histidine phosphatase family protein n=1 Tax=Streptomyces sp. NPDC047108 TaxID=3155025 RepID=UPI0033FE2DEA